MKKDGHWNLLVLTYVCKRVFSQKSAELILWSRLEMAKPATVLIKMVSTADTGHYYVTKKNPRTQTEKLELKKYDPVVRKHVLYKEGKIK